MACNVLTWRDALAKGYQPGLYSYVDVPIGEYVARLDFKIWAKKVMAINCYFTVIKIGKKIQLTVYCNEAGVYKTGNSDVKFATCPIEQIYQITVIANQNKKMVLTDGNMPGEKRE